MATSKHYMANPVVSFGDEGEDGAILFNPDTCDAAIINATGKVVWQYILAPRTTTEIKAHLAERFRNIPPDQLTKDVEGFLNTLLPDFIQEAKDEHGSE